MLYGILKLIIQINIPSKGCVWVKKIQMVLFFKMIILKKNDQNPYMLIWGKKPLIYFFGSATFGKIQLIENTIRPHLELCQLPTPFLLAVYWIGNYLNLFLMLTKAHTWVSVSWGMWEAGNFFYGSFSPSGMGFDLIPCECVCICICGWLLNFQVP